MLLLGLNFLSFHVCDDSFSIVSNTFSITFCQSFSLYCFHSLCFQMFGLKNTDSRVRSCSL
uniref:Uncharacterized protein n=1 Tax=Rhizophora mucronata TaxID=61149 RepID=A0A2P2NQK5_RHIMU